MPSSTLLIDPHDPDLKRKVQKLAPTPGYCIFVDIVGSTEMKQQGLLRWIAFIHNAFANVAAFLGSPFHPLKGIGDEVMYYIETADLEASGNSALSVFDPLWQITKENSADFPEVKVVAAKCEDVFPLTFLPGVPDYYGSDIDLTARLKSKVRSREIIIDGRFRDEVIAEYDGIGNKPQFRSVQALGAEETERFKGFQQQTRFYRA